MSSCGPPGGKELRLHDHSNNFTVYYPTEQQVATYANVKHQEVNSNLLKSLT